MLEIDSEIAGDVKECKQFLQQRLANLTRVAKKAGFIIGMTGTHPFQQWKDGLITDLKRYQRLHQKFQWLARRMNIYGLHVHIGMHSKMEALSISQGLIRYLPLLLALSANSPFWQGIDTGMQSSRISVIDSFPTAQTPPFFENWEEFEYFYRTLNQSHAIQSVKDLYWYVRPNISFGTIELRICDCLPTLSETMAVVAFTHSLVAWLGKQHEKGEIFAKKEYHWLFPYNQWIAARDGMDGKIDFDLSGKKQKISDILLHLCNELEETAKELNCFEELCDLKTMISEGNGAQKQRAIFQETNSLTDVVSRMNQQFQADLAL